MFERTKRSMQARAGALLVSIESGLDRILLAWLLLAGLAAATRVIVTPAHAPLTPDGVLPYMLLILAPATSMVLALRWFADGDRLAQPKSRLARLGRWRGVGRGPATRHALYGASGIMVSLLVGMLLNVPVRAAEYLAAMPPISGAVPAWLSTLHMLMTLDVVLLTSLYTIAFVAALRRVPLFPRLLAAIWLVDVAMQLLIAEMVAGTPGLPAPVASALHTLLDGNVKKVLISVALWLPYLLLSKRVNITYRHRLPA